MGYVMLGMASFTTQGINGAVLQMFNSWHDHGDALPSGRRHLRPGASP
jgi:hypothetical protein